MKWDFQTVVKTNYIDGCRKYSLSDFPSLKQAHGIRQKQQFLLTVILIWILSTLTDMNVP